jgi:DNA-binding protein HU-beta
MTVEHKSSQKLSKTHIIDQLARKSVITKKESEQYINNLLEIIQDNLSNGYEVAFMGFGNFSINKREAREGRNPRTGEAIQIEAKNAIKFKAGKAFEEKVN